LSSRTGNPLVTDRGEKEVWRYPKARIMDPKNKSWDDGIK